MDVADTTVLLCSVTSAHFTSVHASEPKSLSSPVHEPQAVNAKQIHLDLLAVVLFRWQRKIIKKKIVRMLSCDRGRKWVGYSLSDRGHLFRNCCSMNKHTSMPDQSPRTLLCLGCFFSFIFSFISFFMLGLMLGGCCCSLLGLCFVHSSSAIPSTPSQTMF